MVMVGSRVTCNPPPMDTDEDHLVLVDDALKAVDTLKDFGFEFDSKKYSGMGPLGFVSLRFGELNYIVTEDKDFFTTFLSATALAKRFNLLKKEDRIALFDAVFARKSFASEVLPGWNHLPEDIVTRAQKSGKEEGRRLTAAALKSHKGFSWLPKNDAAQSF